MDEIRNKDYIRFLEDSVLRAGVDLFFKRHMQNPDFPYPDTKFNPNTGRDLAPESYGRIYTWFLGRGSEAFSSHIRLMEKGGITSQTGKKAMLFFREALNNQIKAVREITAKNKNCCPFIVDREFSAIDTAGIPSPVIPEYRSAGDLFCSKGLLCSDNTEDKKAGLSMLKEYTDAVFNLRYRSYHVKEPEDRISQGQFMLILGAFPLALSAVTSEKDTEKLADECLNIMDFVIERYYDEKKKLLCEYIDSVTHEKIPVTDPGHAIEFAGLGYKSINAFSEVSSLKGSEVIINLRKKHEFLENIIKSSFKTGFTKKHGGIYKLSDTKTGSPLNTEMPWWNLPETMRAAALAASFPGSEDKETLFRIFSEASNAYFRHYINTDNGLFPYQTRCGKTGRVLDTTPAIPEGDPLYHANLSIIDLLQSIQA